MHTPDLLLFTESDLYFPCCLFSKTPKASESQRTFGGFKRGFLTNPKPRKVNSTHSSKSAKESADMPVIRSKNPEHKTKGIEIPEVQEAMKSSIPSLENKGNQKGERVQNMDPLFFLPLKILLMPKSLLEGRCLRARSFGNIPE